MTPVKTELAGCFSCRSRRALVQYPDSRLVIYTNPIGHIPDRLIAGNILRPRTTAGFISIDRFLQNRAPILLFTF